MRPRIPALLGTVLFATALLVAPAFAHPDDEDGKPARFVTVPDLQGQDARQATRRLEALGLDVAVITVAGPTPDTVDRQDPSPGTAVRLGQEVVLYVGIRPLVQTIAPDVVGMDGEEAIRRLEASYVLDIDFVAGPAAREGKVTYQEPTPGTRIPFRGRFHIHIVRNAFLVPSLLGLAEAEARERARKVGLLLDVRYVRDASVPAGIVISQDLGAGALLLPGLRLQIRVAGPASGFDRRPHRVAVPDLQGATFWEAMDELVGLGLVARIGSEEALDVPAFTVVGQDPVPGTTVAEGAEVGLVVAKPARMPAVLPLPPLHGLHMNGATGLLRSMGFTAIGQRIPSVFPEGTVIDQTPAPGTRMRAGSRIVLGVAQRADRSLGRTRVPVPDLAGLSASEARIELMRHNLYGLLSRMLAPDRDVDKVVGQQPEANRAVAPGTRVRFYLPYRSLVPDLIGKTQAEAIELLELAGLTPAPSGPPRGFGRARVDHQDVPAGSVISRGSRVGFRYRFLRTGGRPVLVPGVVGMRLEQAAAELEALDLAVAAQGPAAGAGVRRVVGQAPAAGTRVPIGTRVTLVYEYSRAVPGVRRVEVPNFVGQSLFEALKRAFDAGLRIEFSQLRIGRSQRVIGQEPAAGERIEPGGTVKLQLR